MTKLSPSKISLSKNPKPSHHFLLMLRLECIPTICSLHSISSNFILHRFSSSSSTSTLIRHSDSLLTRIFSCFHSSNFLPLISSSFSFSFLLFSLPASSSSLQNSLSFLSSLLIIISLNLSILLPPQSFLRLFALFTPLIKPKSPFSPPSLPLLIVGSNSSSSRSPSNPPSQSIPKSIPSTSGLSPSTNPPYSKIAAATTASLSSTTNKADADADVDT